jgi:fucose 4-O-acetylase-like acetyltransferase
VVGGHVLEGLREASILPESPALLFLHRFLYAFHMPLFFFASGLLAARSIERGARSFLEGRLRTVAYPYVVWSVLQALVLIALSPLTRDRPDASLLLRLPYHPLMQLWFLYALFIIALVFAGLHALGLRARGLVLLSLVLYAIVPYLGLHWEVAQAVLVFFIYFAAGVWLSPRLLAPSGPSPRPAWGPALVALLAAGVALGFDQRWVTRPLAAVLGIAATLIVARLIETAGRLGFFITWGRLSLPIYVAHLMAVIASRVVLVRLGVTNGPAHVVAGLVAGLGGPLLLAWACERAGLRHAFVLEGPMDGEHTGEGVAVAGRADEVSPGAARRLDR